MIRIIFAFAAGFVFVHGRFAAAQERPVQEWFQGWEMEDRIAQAQLCLVAKVSHVKDLTVVHGAKVDRTLREYHFQPVRVLKGIFSRDEFVMTDSDLGFPAEDGTSVPPLQQGELRLLLLARTAEGLGCVSGPSGPQTPQAQVPKLESPGDPVVAMAEDLVRISESPSRRERSEHCVRALAKVTGPAAVPLLLSLSRRAVWAAQVNDVAGSLVRLARDKSPAIQAAAVQTIERVLAAETSGQNTALRVEVAEALRELLAAATIETAARVSALRAIGHLGEQGRSLPWPSEILTRHLVEGKTHAERTAAALALADLGEAKNARRLLDALEALPLDEDPRRVQAFASSAVRLAGQGALEVLIRRLEAKTSARRPVAPEVIELAKLRSRDAIPALLRAAEVFSLSDPSIELCGNVHIRTGEPEWSAEAWIAAGEWVGEQYALSKAFQEIKDERAVPMLSSWLRSPYDWLRHRAFLALEAVDGDEAAQAVRLRLKAEPQLPLKLRMARMLGRRGINDGYALALEHLADPGITELAAAALGALRDGRTNAELWKILESSHDRAWNGAALDGLAAVGDAKARTRIVAILGNARDPLLADAARAAARLEGLEALSSLKPLVGSRNTRVALSALQSLEKMLAPERRGNDASRATAAQEAGTAVLAVLNDPDAEHELRLAALTTFLSLGDSRVAAALRTLADQAELERHPLLDRVEKELALRRA